MCRKREAAVAVRAGWAPARRSSGAMGLAWRRSLCTGHHGRGLGLAARDWLRGNAPAARLSSSLIDLLHRAGLCRQGETPHAEPLAGGVSSEIWRVDLASGPVCVKRALPRLRVAQVWEAPVSRNRYEYEWFRTAAAAAPQAVPKVIAHDESAFVMEYLDPERHPVWKDLLRQGRADPASRRVLPHARCDSQPTTSCRALPTDEIFYASARALPGRKWAGRIRPCREFRFPVASSAGTRLAWFRRRQPQNILPGRRGGLLDGVRWSGYPAFDLAFCLNHSANASGAACSGGFPECFDTLASLTPKPSFKVSRPPPASLFRGSCSPGSTASRVGISHGRIAKAHVRGSSPIASKAGSTLSLCERALQNH